MKLKITLLALGVTLLSVGQSSADLLTASDILRISFTKGPADWNPADPPDALGLNLFGLPQASGFDLTGSTTKLFDNGVLLGTDTRIGTQAIDIAPFFSYLGAETGQDIPAPTLVHFASILDGSIDGQIDFQLHSGSMLVILGPLLLRLIDVTGPTSSSSNPLWLSMDIEIVSAPPTPEPSVVPEPTTLLLLLTGLVTARQMRRGGVMRRAVATVFGTTCLLTVGILPAHAAPILLIEGVVTGNFLQVVSNPPAGAPGNLSVEAPTQAFTTRFDNVPIAGGPVPTTFDDFVNVVAASSVAGGITTYSFAPTPGSSRKELHFEPVHGSGSASFEITLTRALVNNAIPDTVVFEGTETLQFDLSPTFDFSAFAAGSAFSLTITNEFENFNDLFTLGGFAFTAGTTGRFTQAALPQATVPEPSSLLLLVSGGPLLIRALRRRRRRS